MSTLTDYQTGADLEGTISEGLAAALQDAAGESPEGTVIARSVGDVWIYVRPSERRPGDRTVFCDH